MPRGSDGSQGGGAGYGSRIADIMTKKRSQLPQYEYLFRVELPDIPQSPPVSEINHRVYSVTLPNTAWETRKNIEGGAYWYSATSEDIGNVVMKLDDYEDGATFSYLQRWQALYGDLSDFRSGEKSVLKGGRAAPVFYKKAIKIIRLSSTLKDIHQHVYKGYFPTDIGTVGFSHDGSGLLQYDVTFTGDRVEHKMDDYSSVLEKMRKEHEDIIDLLQNRKAARLYNEYQRGEGLRDTTPRIFGSLPQVQTLGYKDRLVAYMKREIEQAIHEKTKNVMDFPKNFPSHFEERIIEGIERRLNKMQEFEQAKEAVMEFYPWYVNERNTENVPSSPGVFPNIDMLPDAKNRT